MPADSTVILPTVILSAALGSIRTSHKRARRLFRLTRLVILSVAEGSIRTSSIDAYCFPRQSRRGKHPQAFCVSPAFSRYC